MLDIVIKGKLYNLEKVLKGRKGVNNKFKVYVYGIRFYFRVDIIVR